MENVSSYFLIHGIVTLSAIVVKVESKLITTRYIIALCYTLRDNDKCGKQIGIQTHKIHYVTNTEGRVMTFYCGRVRKGKWWCYKQFISAGIPHMMWFQQRTK